MKIYIENQILKFEKSIKEIDSIFEEIDNIVNKSSKILSHMVIDSIEVYQDYYDYFLDNIRVIEEVKVITLTYKELVDDILNSTLDYLERTPTIIENLADNFYKNPDNQDWQELDNLLDGISWIMTTFSSIDQDKRLKDIIINYEDWNRYAKEIFSLKELLVEFEEALSSNDNVSIADILSYEIVPIFITMKERLVELIDIEIIKEKLN
ncbi:hypothetical protein [uncultured Tissierella sp.]|uniref:hypothetical protein n=1 Tax=uncultured Tissierella sp. TaxID=448160 RepID=UPI0028060BBA|nr:hypothetical protein [uncultured Tissierella sp.]MDU5079766.1 hypothetical protein [Bacillota bacterium]